MRAGQSRPSERVWLRFSHVSPLRRKHGITDPVQQELLLARITEMIPKTRLGKRSPFGALVCSSSPEPDKPLFTAATGAGLQGMSRVKGQNDLKGYFQCGGAPCSAVSCSKPVSSCINVPKSTSKQEVDMDELMVAMVLSSLSCSPPPLSPPQVSHKENAAPSGDSGATELSDSSSSGYWSIGPAPGSPAPSGSGPDSPPDEGLDMEMDEVLFEEPASRRPRNSSKVAYRCLWPSCGKVLTSVVGIKRHIRTVHLSHGGEHERCSRSEEDFYYTEVNQSDDQQNRAPSPPLLSELAPTSPPSPPPPSPPSPPTCSVLSRSAPSHSGTLWQVQSEHSYQALSPDQKTSLLYRQAAPPTTCTRQAVASRVRSVSVGEQWLQQHNAPCRKIRSDAKKCRKVYGIEHRDLWCTACRWKKACQRFLD